MFFRQTSDIEPPIKGVWFQLHQKSFFHKKIKIAISKISKFKFRIIIIIPMPVTRSLFIVCFNRDGWWMHVGDFIRSMLWGFKFQIEIGDVDFETGIWAETYHNWALAKIDDAWSPWIHGPRQSSNMLIGSIRREEFISSLILGWFLIFLGGGLIWTQTYSTFLPCTTHSTYDYTLINWDEWTYLT